MSDELLLEKLDSYHHKLTDDAAARIRAQAARIAELEGQSGLDRIAAHNRTTELEKALLAFVTSAQHYHDECGHGEEGSVAQCDEICECLSAGVKALRAAEKGER